MVDADTSGDVKQFPVRLPPELRRRLQARADELEVSMAELVRRGVETVLDDTEPPSFDDVGARPLGEGDNTQ